MKKIFCAVLALAAMASCSKEYTVDYNKQAIAFGEAFVDNATRVDYSTPGSLKKFFVYGTASGTMNGGGTVNIFDGDTVTGTVGNTVWTCTETQYWIPGADYDFAAVVDATVNADANNGDLDIDTNGMPIKLHTQADDATEGNMNLKDMLYAEASVAGTVVTDTYDTPVNFTFNHLLSKVHFTVTSTAQGDYYHTVTGIKVANFEEGTYTIAGGTWSASTDDDNKKDVVFADIEEVTNTGGKSNADMLLVPTDDAFNVTFTVDLYKNGTKLGTETNIIEVDNALVKGHAYNFIIACSVGNPIQFKVTNDPTWDTTNGDITIE